MSHKCVVCGGSGECPECYGSGRNVHLNTEGDICERCKGSGKCTNCGGVRTGFHLGDLLRKLTGKKQTA